MKEKNKKTKRAKLSGAEKTAVVLLAMNHENSSRVFSTLREEEIKELSQTMASLGNIDNEVIEGVISDFKEEVTTRISIVGNLDTTEQLLESVMDPSKVSMIMEDIKGPMGKNTWDKLSNVNESLLTAYLKNEYPQTIALILSKISPTMASKILSMLPEELSYEVMMRMLNLDSVKKEVLERIESTLRVDFISTLSKVQDRDRHEIMADVFNNFDRNTEAKFMGMLEERVPDHAEKVKALMFTFDDLIKLKSSDMGAVLRSIDKDKLTIALKGANESLRELFINNMSKRAAKLLLEDMEAMGPIKLKDVDEAQSAILNVVQDMIDREEIELSSGEEDEYIE